MHHMGAIPSHPAWQLGPKKCHRGVSAIGAKRTKVYLIVLTLACTLQMLHCESVLQSSS